MVAPRPSHVAIVNATLLLALAACGDDEAALPPDTMQDGNGAMDGPGATPDDRCERGPAICGNGDVEPGESCEPPGTARCDEDCQRIPEQAAEPACDLTGHWAVEKLTISVALGVQAITRDHIYYHIVQDGNGFEIVSSMDCGFISDTPLLNVTLGSQTREALRCRVDSNGRTGTARALDDGCEISFHTWYTIRGLSPIDYWRDDDWAPDTMRAATPSKAAPTAPGCTCDSQGCTCDDTGRYDPETGTPGWDDWDGDGGPGITFRPGNSKWHVHMRDWDRFHGTVPPGSAQQPLESMQLDVEWWNIQGIMAHTEGAIVVEDEPDLSADHHVRLERLDVPDRNAITDEALCQRVLEAFQD